MNLFLVVLEAEESNMEVSASVEFLRHHPTGDGRREKGELSKYTPPSLFNWCQSLRDGGTLIT